MSVYNGAHWLGDAIESTIKQSFQDFEFIIVDDGSTDNTDLIIKSFQQRDSRIKIISKSHTGLADSLNKGLELAQGEWIARLDADDLSEPDRLAKQIAFADSNPNMVLIGAGMKSIDSSGNIRLESVPPADSKKLVKRLISLQDFFAHSSAFFQTKAARGLGGYRVRLKRAQDYDLWLRFSEIGVLGAIPEPLVRHRMHPLQVSREDGGLRQKIDARVALTSYWLRRMGMADPVADNDEVFFQFWSWVSERMTTKGGYFAYLNYLKRFRDKKAACFRSIQDFIEFLEFLIKERSFFATFVASRTNGDVFCREIASSWARKTIENN